LRTLCKPNGENSPVAIGYDLSEVDARKANGLNPEGAKGESAIPVVRPFAAGPN